MTVSMYFYSVMLITLHTVVAPSPPSPRTPKPMTGTLFLFGVPTMRGANSKGILHMYSFSDYEVTVLITIPGVESVSTLHSDTVQLSASRISTYTIDHKYNALHLMEKQPCINLTGNLDFGVHLILVDGERSAGALQMIPVSAWGTNYYALTVHSTLFMHLMSSEKDNKILFTITETDIVEFPYHTHEWNLTLQSGEMYVYADCFLYVHPFFGTTLSVITIESSLPVGVIIGNCYGYTNITYCDPTDTGYGVTFDIVAEMPPPTSLYGTEFITLVINGRRSAGEVIVYAPEGQTTVTMHSPEPRYYVPKVGEWVYLEEASTIIPIFVTSDRPMLVTLLQRSACYLDIGQPEELKEPGDMALSIIVPNSLFYLSYMWKTPLSDQMELVHYIIIVSLEKFKKHIQINEQSAASMFYSQDVMGNMNWSVLIGNISQGEYIVQSTRMKVFGCYFYGLGEEVAYMQPGGYLDTPEDVSCKEPKVMAAGDLWDNDCDGRLDEESSRTKDGDKDGLTMEDIAAPDARNGYWNKWLEWKCSDICGDPYMYRKRTCTRPEPEALGEQCKGPSTVRIAGSCADNDTCPPQAEPERNSSYWVYIATLVILACGASIIWYIGKDTALFCTGSSKLEDRAAAPEEIMEQIDTEEVPEDPLQLGSSTLSFLGIFPKTAMSIIESTTAFLPGAALSDTAPSVTSVSQKSNKTT